ncbi:hypothetical protein K431DRAFT_321991 [Polychaeton citri CBS 116435]|uniref:Enkurin domain-containing protein n=1 Tax=Polychaeton citri CBS 116435 TaxID=1314669 RepID=A0A9P4UM05_9PEZI|nr:hypothetical protein K431DRAFT_321991 [Polychaeton citri CBS 116435]
MLSQPCQDSRRVYSAQFLHRLRGTSSAPKLTESIDQHDGADADVVKEHVLRGTKSFAVRSFRSRPVATARTFRVPSDSSDKENQSTASNSDLNDNADTYQPLGTISTNSQILRTCSHLYRRSPTPSLRRKRAEAIVKAHGSPTHIRVTAGGRIVPKDQSPLCFPRFGYSAVKVNNGLIKFAPNHPTGKVQQWAQATMATTDGMLAQDPQGTLCQIVKGQILPLIEIDGTLRLHMPAPNLNVTQAGPPFLQPWQQRRSSINLAANLHAAGPPQVSVHNRNAADEPSPTQQLGALELEYSKLEHELKELDKTEVLHGRSMGKVAKEALVGKRRELVTTMDRIRKGIKGLKETPQQSSSSHAEQALHQESQQQTRDPYL